MINELKILQPITVRVTAPVRLPVQVRYVDDRLSTTPEWQPRYHSEGAAGFDLRALASGIGDRRLPLVDVLEIGVRHTDIPPGQARTFGTGIALAIPPGYELQIRGRSSLNAKGLVVLLGTVDSDYRGEVGVTLINLSGETQRICAGDRLSQGVIAPVVQGVFAVVDELPETARGTGGFGSTGVR